MMHLERRGRFTLAAMAAMAILAAASHAQSTEGTERDPDELVHCNISGSMTWVKWSVCKVLFEEARSASVKSVRLNRYAIVQECAASLGKKYPSGDRADQLNVCEGIVAALRIQ